MWDYAGASFGVTSSGTTSLSIGAGSAGDGLESITGGSGRMRSSLAYVLFGTYSVGC